MLHPFQSYPLLNQLSAEDLLQLNLEIQEQHYSSTQLILIQGEFSKRVHIMVSGHARVFIEHERKVELADLHRGHFFGEMSCLTGDPISAYVEAVDDVHTITVSRAGMLLLMDKNTDFRRQIVEAMIKRIQSSNERVLEEHTKSILILKQNKSEEQERYGRLIGASPAMQQLLDHIERLSITREHIILVGEAGTGKTNIARKLHYSSTNGHYPILTLSGSDLDLPTWDTHVRAAKGGTLVVDRVEQLSPTILKQILATDNQTRIVITSSKPLDLSGITMLYVPPLRERVEDIPLLAQYFVGKEGAEDTELAISQDALRVLSLFPFLNNNVKELQGVIKRAYILSEGRTIYSNHLHFGRPRKAGDRPTIGLALGSGSVRGMAHLGVLRVLEEENIPIDMIAGTSVGSLVGGAYAAGMPVRTVFMSSQPFAGVESSDQPSLNARLYIIHR